MEKEKKKNYLIKMMCYGGTTTFDTHTPDKVEETFNQRGLVTVKGKDGLTGVYDTSKYHYLEITEIKE